MATHSWSVCEARGQGDEQARVTRTSHFDTECGGALDLKLLSVGGTALGWRLWGRGFSCVWG